MNPNPAPSPNALPPVVTYRSFINELMGKLGEWGHGGRMERVLAMMMSRFLGWLRDQMEVWMAQMEAGELVRTPVPEMAAQAEEITEAGTEAATPEPVAKPAAKRKPLPWEVPLPADVRAAAMQASIAAREGDEIWERKPQWTLAFTWPYLRPAGTPCTRRPFNWMQREVAHDAGYFHLRLTQLLTTAPMIELLGCCKPAVQAWSPLCWMFGVNVNLLRHPGQIPPPRPPRTQRPRLSREEKWLRALARDPNPYVRYVQHREDQTRTGWPARMELRPRGSFYMEHPHWPRMHQKKG